MTHPPWLACARLTHMQVPIICICNDRGSTKVRSLANHCYDLRFHRPNKARLLLVEARFRVVD